MIIPEAKFLVGVFGDPRCLGKVNMDTKEIMLSLEHKQKPFFELLTTIVEEYEHLRTGFSDETRAFQQHFINLYTYNLVKNEIIL